MEPQTPVNPEPIIPQPPIAADPAQALPIMSDPSAMPDVAVPVAPASPVIAEMPGTTPFAAPEAGDPYAQPGIDPVTGGPEAPAMPTEPVPLAQPASVPAFMNPAPLSGQVNAGSGKKRSRLPLIIVIIVVLLLALGGGAYALTRKKDTKPVVKADTSSQTNPTDNKSTDTKTDKPISTKAATVAKYSSDFDEVCKGGAISNAADYTTNKTAIIYAFHNSVITDTSWSSDLIGYGKSYYLKDLDKFSTISVVACAQYVDGSANGGITCDYKAADGTSTTIKYQATKYDLTFYEAKTGKKISDGGEIVGTATKCPSSILYDSAKKTGYADPDRDALEAAADTFVK